MSEPNKMPSSSNSPYARAKKYSRFGSSSMDDFKREIRNDFKNRIKELRHANVDRNRTSLGTDIKREFEEIKNYLRDGELMDQNELFHVLDVVQKEILQEELQEQGEQHEREMQQEISSILEGLVNTCSVCESNLNKTPNSNVICDNCSKHFE